MNFLDLVPPNSLTPVTYLSPSFHTPTTSTTKRNSHALEMKNNRVAWTPQITSQAPAPDEIHSPCLVSFLENFSALRTQYRWHFSFLKSPPCPNPNCPPQPGQNMTVYFWVIPLFFPHPEAPLYGCLSPLPVSHSFQIRVWLPFYPYHLKQWHQEMVNKYMLRCTFTW